MAEREFPNKCPNCRQKAVGIKTIPYSTKFDFDGQLHTVHISDLSVPVCDNCGTVVLDEVANRKISEVFRIQAGLLGPEEIRKGREELGYSVSDFAKALGVTESTVSRWEVGVQIQERFQNDVVRAFFCVPALRVFLEEIHAVRSSRNGSFPLTRSEAVPSINTDSDHFPDPQTRAG